MMSASADVRIYVTDWCPYCVQAKKLLSKKGANFVEVNVEGRDDLRSWLRSASGQRTVPQIFINGKSMGGFSDIDALDRAGRLDPLLAEAAAPDLANLPS
jgi:glutaredoxin 3